MKEIARQVEINNAFVSKHANDVQQVLEEHRAAIIDEKNTEYRKLRSAQEAWKRELEEIYAKNNFKSPILTLDCGGQGTVKASKALLCSFPGSVLERTFNGYHSHTKLGEDIFIDREAKPFQHVVNYLRYRQGYHPIFETRNEEDLFIRELEFWGIKTKIFGQAIEEKKLCDKLP